VSTFTTSAPIPPQTPPPGSRRDAPAAPVAPPIRCAEPARLWLFGGWLLEGAGRPAVVPIAAQRLIAYVALHGGATRSRVAGTLWPDVSDTHSNGSLRSTMWRVHKHRPGMLHDVGGMLSLCPDVTVDVAEFNANARSLIEGQSGNAGQELFIRRGGELLPGWYDDWVVFERERLRQLRLHALDVLATSLCDRGRYAQALDVALDAVNTEPLRESAHRTIVRIHLAEGNVAEALRAYRACRQLLDAELGVAPSAALHQLLVDAGIADVAS
jgi:DNA-binding SARP family transcriptional activator